MNTKLVLPNFINGYKCNEILINEFKTQIPIDGLLGGVPFHILNGEYNMNKILNFFGMPELKDHIFLYAEMGITNFYLYTTNTLLKDTDYLDIFSQNIFKFFSSNASMVLNYYIIANDLDLIKYLNKNFSNLKVIYQINFQTNKEILLSLKNYSNVVGFQIPFIYFSEFKDYLISNFSSNYIFMGILPLNRCKECMNYINCHKIECQNILNFSEKLHFDSCKNKTFYSIEEILDMYNILSEHCSLIAFEEISTERTTVDFQVIEDFLNLIKNSEE